MRLIKVAVLVAVITVTSSGNVLAGSYESGNSLLESCRAADASWSGGFCLGYITGIADAMETDGILGWRKCTPNGVTLRQTADVVKAWLESYPQYRHNTAHSLVAEALAKAFPCKA